MGLVAGAVGDAGHAHGTWASEPTVLASPSAHPPTAVRRPGSGKRREASAARGKAWPRTPQAHGAAVASPVGSRSVGAEGGPCEEAQVLPRCPAGSGRPQELREAEGGDRGSPAPPVGQVPAVPLPSPPLRCCLATGLLPAGLSCTLVWVPVGQQSQATGSGCRQVAGRGWSPAG